MRKLKILIISILCLLSLLTFTPLTMAKEEVFKSKGAFGFGFSLIGGSGLAYKQFIGPDQALQYAGAIRGSSDSYIDYNFGVMYQKVLHESQKTRLLFSPGVSWMQVIDLNEDDDISEYKNISGDNYYYLNKSDEKRFSTGVTFGIEWKFDKISVGAFMGYQGNQYYRYDDGDYSNREEALAEEMKSTFEFGSTGGLSLFYYF